MFATARRDEAGRAAVGALPSVAVRFPELEMAALMTGLTAVAAVLLGWIASADR